MNEMERNTTEAKEAVQRVYSEGFGNEAGAGENSQAYGFVGVRDLLNGVLRPRLVSLKGKDPNWQETYLRLVEVYDILLSNVSLRLGEEVLEGSLNAVMDPKNYFLDLTEVFYELFPQARSVNVPIPRRSLRPNVLLVMDENLTKFLSPDVLRDNFGRLVEGTRFGFRSPFTPSGDKVARVPRAEKRNPNYLRFREAISLAARSLSENLSEERARAILHEVLESYLSYAQNIRSLPKPELGLEG
jgi:hypothetical protein